jgi:asparagine synthase (glutamine-hydrolysing)
MSAIATIVSLGSRDAAPIAEPQVAALLKAMPGRGNDVLATHGNGAPITAGYGLARYEWEDRMSPAQGPVEVDGCVVVADATLYYQEDLRRKISDAGISAGHTPAHLIGAAYQAFGERSFALIEGDYSFVLHDLRQQKVFAVRDFVGQRPLHYALLPDHLVIASTIGGVCAWPGCPRAYDLLALAETTSFLLADGEATGFEAVRSVPAGHYLALDVQNGRSSVQRFWHPPKFNSDDPVDMSFEEAANHLLALIEHAVDERTPAAGATAITLSGGYDSPAVYAVMHRVNDKRGAARDTIIPVSMSFPEGDIGREDELIRSITAQYGQESLWLDTTRVPLLDNGLLSDDPFVHPYLNVNRQMIRLAAGAGARVVFNGFGGDNLFHGELSYLSDLLARRRIMALRRAWKDEQLSGIALFARHVVWPLAGPRTRKLAGWLRGRPVANAHIERRPAPWINSPLREAAFQHEEQTGPRRRPGEPMESFEHRWMFEHQLFPRVSSSLASMSLHAGVEQRSPLVDERIVRFAATRPRIERRRAGHTKRLLRHAVAGLLPDEVLAVRSHKTGTMTDYLTKGISDGVAAVVCEMFSGSLLSQMGIIDENRLLRAVQTFHPSRLRPYDPAIILTLQVENWLRTHADHALLAHTGEYLVPDSPLFSP